MPLVKVFLKEVEMKPVIVECKAFFFCVDDLTPDQLNELREDGRHVVNSRQIDNVVQAFREELEASRKITAGHALLSWSTSTSNA